MMLKQAGRWCAGVVPAVLLACAATAFIFALHPRLGIRDVDGVAYIIGADSIRSGHGYRSLTDEGLNHWPPGYSLLLSLFPDSIKAAKIVNYISFGAAIGLFHYLLRRSGWTWQAATGLAVALAAGFFRLLANAAHADITTYALFLAGLSIALGRHESRLLPALIWAALIPVKLIAVVFLPPALAADCVSSAPPWRKLLRMYWLGAVASASGVASILVFNHATIGAWIPSSHEHSTFRTLLSGFRTFVASIPREFLFNWHSSVTAPFPRAAYPLCLLLAAVCLLSLRPARQPELEGRWFRTYGVWCLACSALLLLVRYYEPSVRLVGYGLLVLFLGFRPKMWANSIWLMYGAASLIVGVVNATTVNSLGSADPRYAELAAQVHQYYQASGQTAKVVATNSAYLLDLFANIASVPVESAEQGTPNDRFLWVTLPNFDPGASSVVPIDRPGPGWCEQQQFAGGILFARCAKTQ